MDIFQHLADANINPLRLVELRELDEQRHAWTERKPFLPIRNLWPLLPEAPQTWRIEGSDVVAGPTLQDADRDIVQQAAEALIPWKKGPFRLCDITIDAEWRSDYKWDRFQEHLPNLEGADILDVGGHNGYYGFRLLERNPRFVCNLDPVPRLWWQFRLLQRYAGIPNFDFRLWGWEQMADWPPCFDAIFCMGILYHHEEPVNLLRLLRQALRPGGLLVMETIVIPGDESICLFPQDRYARMRNVWFVPTVSATQAMLERAKFEQIKVIATNKHQPDEQRTTRWNPGPSYADFLNPENPDLTQENHPAPWRSILFAQKPR